MAIRQFGTCVLLSAVILCSVIFSHNVNAYSPVTPINHVIIVMQENHSFDNYFGTYPTANGTLVDNLTSSLQKVNGIPNGVCLPYGPGCIAPYYESGFNTTATIEGQTTYENDVNGGRMDGFARYSGPQAMAYFDYHQLASYWDYAEEYGLAENYFASALSTTTPNRLLLFAGDTSVSYNYGPPPFVPYNRTVLNQLDENNISWGYFDFFGSLKNASQAYPFIYTSDVPSSSIRNVQNVSSFFGELGTGGLPAVSFVMALGSDGLDEHPPSNVTAGEQWTVSIVNAIMRSNYWNSSAIFITWDEGGGYYDHVVPPQVLTIDHEFDHPLQVFGQRVPLLVISPYVKENYVSQAILNHMSLLRFIEFNWGLPSLDENVASSNNLLDFFSFNSPRSPIILGTAGKFAASKYPIPIQIQIGDLQYPRIGSMTDSDYGLAPRADYRLVASGLLVVIVLGVLTVRRRKSDHALNKLNRCQVSLHEVRIF